MKCRHLLFPSSATLLPTLRRTAFCHGGCGARVGIGIRRSFDLLSVSARRDNPDVSRKPQPSKNMLRAKHIGKDYSSLGPVLLPDHKPSLLASQAFGNVATAQANFIRVVVQDDDGAVDVEGDDRSSKNGVELLCVVRAVLKNIRRRALAGDKVLVGSIHWVDRRGMIETVFQRRTEILDPPVANIDQPKLEPFTLTRFLVEAESTGIPLTHRRGNDEEIAQKVFLFC